MPSPRTDRPANSRGDLSSFEKDTLLPLLIKGLETKLGESNAITSTQIIRRLEERGVKCNDMQIRNCIRYIRQKHLLPCLASSSHKGYWIETNPHQLKRCITRLRARAQEQLASAEALAQDYYQLTQTRLDP